MFELASKLKLRFFGTPSGTITVEDLWDLPLKAVNNGTCLNDIAKNLSKKLKEDEEDFVSEKSGPDEITALKFKIVLRVIEVKIAEQKVANQKAENKIKKQKILEILADKEDSSLKRKSKADLEKMLEEL